MRTLVVSDLHLGIRSGEAVLQGPVARAALVDRLADVDRLVLLGDTVEFRQGPVRDVLRQAVPVLAELGGALGDSKEVVIVPGNHDHRLLGPWRERRSGAPVQAELGLDEVVDWQSGEPLAVLAEALGAGRVRAHYPGLWLRPDVYATHGHYVDRHITVPILERLGAGAMARFMPGPARDPRRIEDYEAVLAPMYDWINAVTEAGGGPRESIQVRVWRDLQQPGARRRWLRRWPALALPVAVAVLNRLGLGPLGPDVSGAELRRAGLLAFDEVLTRLEVPAAHAIFGHTHRAGPVFGDARGEWVSRRGISMVNLGSWVHTPAFLGQAPERSPYRAGFAAVVDDDGPPELINVLDGREWASDPAGVPARADAEAQGSTRPRRIA